MEEEKKDNRIKLKIRKKSTNAKVKSNNAVVTQSLNLNAPLVQRKRSNPFSRDSVKKVHYNDENISEEEEKSKLLQKLDSVNSTQQFTFNRIDSFGGNTEDDLFPENGVSEQKENVSEKTKTLKYTNTNFPLDWGIKQKLQVISKDPLQFCTNLKSRDKAVGIKKFANGDVKDSQFYQHLCTWIYPFIPGIRNFPLRKSAGEKLALGIRDIVSADNINIGKSFQEALLQQWKISFQSLFNMLKTNLCPYFYVCCYQFSMLFKAANLCDGTIKVILTPTTKGFRAMLTEEDITFEFTNKEQAEALEDSPNKNEEKNCLKTRSDDIDYDADVFLNSIGLNKGEQFPDIEEQRKHSMRTELKRLDNRPESTIEISDDQAFFNFLLNFPMLCATSGSLSGIPPTLISPVIFEGAACHVNKYSVGKIKLASGDCLNCLDVYGYIDPMSLKGIVDLTKAQSTEFQVRAKTYDNLFAFNTKACDGAGDETTSEEYTYLTQVPFSIPEQSELQFFENVFKC